MEWSNFFEAGGWMVFSFIKFIVMPSTAIAAGLNPWRVFAYSAGGAAVGLLALQPVVLTVRRDSPFKNLQDFIKAAKARPGTYGIAQAGMVWYKGYERHVNLGDTDLTARVNRLNAPWNAPPGGPTSWNHRGPN